MQGLIFWYAAMNAGKSAQLLQYAHGHTRRGLKVHLFTAHIDDRFGVNQIVSRTGLKKDAESYTNTFSFSDYLQKISDKTNSVFFVDEAQFLTKEQVRELVDVVDQGVTVHCYGLRSDFKGEVFEGAKYLLAWADVLRSIPGVCFCGAAAHMNLRVVDDEVLTEGPQILIGDASHHPSCRKHFFNKEFKN